MKNFIMMFSCVAIIQGCNSNKQSEIVHNDTPTQATVDTLLTLTPSDSIAQFGKKLYMNIAEIHSGEAYTDKDGENVYFRILVIPQEENTMLMAEKIAIGSAEGETTNFKKLSKITNGDQLPEYGYYTPRSLKFVDSVSVKLLFDGKQKIINLQELPYFAPKTD